MSNYTPATLSDTIAAILRDGGFREAEGHLGVATQGSKVIDRSFVLLPGPAPRGVVGGRGRPNAAGWQWEDLYRLEVAHVLKPKAGRAAYDQALKDQHTVLHLLAMHLRCPYTIDGVERITEAGGQYLVTVYSLRLTYTLSLEAPAP